MLKFALAGNPNSGKTTLFNALTGSTAHVGNWPGVTVDKREGTYKKGDEPIDIVDLPGIYSLSPYTPEEVIARNFLLNEQPDCIVNIVDATNLERNLYLTTQLMELSVPMVVALNMTDVLDKNGDKIDVRALEKRIGLPVVEISALKETNVDLLMERALKAVATPREATSVLKESVLGSAIANAEIAFQLKGVDAPLFHAVKLVEKDELEVKNHPSEAAAVEKFICENVGKNEYAGDAEAAIADARYKYITAHFSTTLTRARKSDKADKVLTHKWAGIPIFLVILFAVFHLTFSENLLYLASIIPTFGEWCGAEGNAVKGIFFGGGLNSPGVILFNAMGLLTDTIGEGLAIGLTALDASEPIIGLVCDGVWGGLAGVLSFLPQILVLFLLFSILEDSGYMARVAFMLDRIFRRFGAFVAVGGDGNSRSCLRIPDQLQKFVRECGNMLTDGLHGGRLGFPQNKSVADPIGADVKIQARMLRPPLHILPDADPQALLIGQRMVEPGIPIDAADLENITGLVQKRHEQILAQSLHPRHHAEGTAQGVSVGIHMAHTGHPLGLIYPVLQSRQLLFCENLFHNKRQKYKE